MSSHVFPLSEFVEHVLSAQFLKIIAGKSVKKLDYSDECGIPTRVGGYKCKKVMDSTQQYNNGVK